MTNAIENGGEAKPDDTPAEMPADNRDAGNEMPAPDGDTAPMPEGDTAPVPDTVSPTPTPTEIPQTGGSFTGHPADQSEIDADTIQNGGLGTAMKINAGAMEGESSTETALKRATE